MLGGVHAMLLVLAFPPVFLPVFALLLPLPGLVATRLAGPSLRLGLAYGLGTLPGWAIVHLFLLDITAVGYPFVALILSLYAALFVWLARGAMRSVPWLLAAPLAWSAMELLKGSILFDGYPWHLTAQPLVATPLAPAMKLVGVYGLGLLVAFFWAALLSRERWSLRGARFLAPLALALLVVVAAPLSRLIHSGAPGPLVGGSGIAVVQTNVPQDNKIAWTIDERRADFDDFLRLTREAAAEDPALIVWPETMFPGIALDPESLAALRDASLFYADGAPVTFFADELRRVQREIGVPMLVGAIAYDGFELDVTPEGVRFESDAEYNSAILIEGGEPQAARYDKIHLTPFGEVMPYISWSDWLESRLLSVGAPGMSFSLSEGQKPTVFESSGLRFATPICFEATMSSVCRTLVYEGGERRADALIQLTNDGWFGRWPGGREFHLLMARCRAVELGVPIVRAANTGISGVVTAEGAVTRRLDAFSAGVLLTGPLEAGAPTLYGRVVGDWPAWIALAGTFAALAASFRRKKVKEPVP